MELCLREMGMGVVSWSVRLEYLRKVAEHRRMRGLDLLSRRLEHRCRCIGGLCVAR